MRRMLLAILLVVLCGAPSWSASAAAGKPKKPAPPKDDPRLPRVLLIGDSISIGYTRGVQQLLRGKANVHRIRGNGQHSGVGVKMLATWLGEGTWDVIHFNWGLWDLCYRNPKSKTQGHRDKVGGTLTLTLDQYEKNLTQIVKQLQGTGARLIWAATTPVPPDEAGRIQGDELKYNAVAKKIMDAHGIAIDDLHAAILPKAEQFYIAKGNVHFNAAGNKFLAEKVAAAILAALAKKPCPATRPGKRPPADTGSPR